MAVLNAPRLARERALDPNLIGSRMALAFSTRAPGRRDRGNRRREQRDTQKRAIPKFDSLA